MVSPETLYGDGIVEGGHPRHRPDKRTQLWADIPFSKSQIYLALVRETVFPLSRPSLVCPLGICAQQLLPQQQNFSGPAAVQSGQVLHQAHGRISAEWG